MLEKNLTVAGINSDDTKYLCVCQGLECDAKTEFRDILKNPSSKKFKTLTTELIKRLGASSSQRLSQLIEREELGDNNPSQFLWRLRSLAGSQISDKALPTLFECRHKCRGF